MMQNRMRTTFLALTGALAVSAAALVGCGATEPTDGDTALTFLLNGQRWTSNIETQAILAKPGLVLFTELRFDDRFPLRQNVGFSVPASEWAGVGTYPIHPRFIGDDLYSAYIGESDGDATLAVYRPVGTGGRLEVTRYDEATGEVEGRFEGVYAVDPNYARIPQRELPDTLRVTEGRFRAVIEDRR